MLQSLLKILIITLTLLSATTVCSNDIESILKDKQAPEGVVFEIVSAEQGLLSKLLPTLKQDIIRLRKRFPDIPVAIVTHGTEQFDLTTDNKKNRKHSTQSGRRASQVQRCRCACLWHTRWLV